MLPSLAAAHSQHHQAVTTHLAGAFATSEDVQEGCFPRAGWPHLHARTQLMYVTICSQPFNAHSHMHQMPPTTTVS